MKKYTYVIIDDDDMDRLTFGFHLREYDFLSHVASFSSPTQGLDYICGNQVDIAFLDIEMPGMSGIEIQDRIRDRVRATVFITSHPGFAVEGFNLGVTDYIMKPFDKKRVSECIVKLYDALMTADKASMYDESLAASTVSLKEGFVTKKITLSSIIYFEAMRDYCKVVLRDGGTVHVHANLSAMLNQPEFCEFVRIHKSFAVQRCHVSEISPRRLKMDNGVVLPVGGLYKENIKDL